MKLDKYDEEIVKRLRTAELTTEQLSLRLGLKPRTVNARISKLIASGIIYVSDTNIGSSGKRVFKVCDQSLIHTGH